MRSVFKCLNGGIVSVLFLMVIIGPSSELWYNNRGVTTTTVVVDAFTPSTPLTTMQRLSSYTTRSNTFLSSPKYNDNSKMHIFILNAGGFEWEDPGEVFDQCVENPYKNPDLMKKDGLKIDPARLLSPRLNGSNLYLVGMMGSGKSAVGQIVAKRMGSYTFLDTDEIIEKATKMTIPEIFESEGEEGFRDVEAQILDSVHPYVRCVISTGGGIVCRMSNWSKLQTGLVVWLDVTPEIIYERIKGNTDRPLLQTDDPLQTIKNILNERKEKYGSADVRIEINTNELNENDVADLIIRQLHDYIDDNPPAWKLAKQKAQSDGLDWVQ